MTLESRRSSLRRAGHLFGRSAVQSWTAVAERLSTIVRPFRSSTGPRGASSGIDRSWLFRAAWRYCGPESTCSAQSLKKRIPKTAIAIPPRIASRRASWGVSRNGSATPAVGGRNGLEPEPLVEGRRRRLRPVRVSVLSKQLHLLEPARWRTEEASAERIHRHGQDQVEDQLERKRVHERTRRRGRVAEHVVQDERPERVEDRHHRDGDERRVTPVAAGRFAVPADPVSRDGQQERGDPEGLQRRRVDYETGPETGRGTEDRPAEQRYGDQGHQHAVWRAVG